MFHHNSHMCALWVTTTLFTMGCAHDPIVDELRLERIPENHCALKVTLISEDAPPQTLTTTMGGHTYTHQLQWTTQTNHQYEGVLLGLLADQLVTVSVSETEVPLTASITTDPLPADLPPIEQTVSDYVHTDALTVFPVFQLTPTVDPDWGYLIAADATGTIRWYQDIGHLSLLFSVTADGTILYSKAAETLVEYHPRDGLVTTWDAASSPLDTVHHEAHKLDGDTWAILSTEHERIAGFADDAEYNIIGDVLAEIQTDGTVLWEASVLEFIDPTEVYTDDMHATFWEQWPYDMLETPKDWSHGNAMTWNESRQEWLTSLRNIDQLAAFSREDGSLTWTFGPGGSFVLDEGSRWFSRQHAPVWTSDNTLLIYDNGLQRADASDEDFPFTRVVEYSLDFETYVATERWSYVGPLPYLAPIVGQVTPIEDDTYLITDGAILGGTVEHDGQEVSHFSARLVELDRSTTPKVRSELIIGTPTDVSQTGYVVYRSHRTTPSQFLGIQRER